MTWLDWAVMAAYGAVVLAIGWIANRRQKTSEDYFLGGRRLRWWLVGVSLMATSFSSVALIGGTGFGFGAGMGWLQLQLGDLLALVLVCVLFLPFFSGLGLTTAYEYLERRFGVVARTLASALFILQTLLRASILVYGAALALATVLGWPISSAIVVTAAAAIAYSACGGISAVVWTDLIQLGVILFGVGYCLVFVGAEIPGGFGAVIDGAGSRMQVVTWSAETDTPYNLLGSMVPYAVLAFSLFGTGQQAVQRFLSCNDLGSARRAAVTGWAIGTVALALTLFLGVCLRAWAQHSAPDLLALESDRILPAFIDQYLPSGIAGLMLAAIFAASMSSLDSAIHSMSTAAIVDFRRRFARSRLTAAAELRLARWATVAFGIGATAGALVAAGAGKGMLDLLISWLGYFAGPLLGLFLLGMLTRRANQRGVLIGVGTAFAAVVAVLWGVGGKTPWGFHRLWLAPFSCAVTLVVGWIASVSGPAPASECLRGLTWAALPAERGPDGALGLQRTGTSS